MVFFLVFGSLLMLFSIPFSVSFLVVFSSICVAFLLVSVIKHCSSQSFLLI